MRLNSERIVYNKKDLCFLVSIWHFQEHEIEKSYQNSTVVYRCATKRGTKFSFPARSTT